jgi:hypothetical protein
MCAIWDTAIFPKSGGPRLAVVWLLVWLSLGFSYAQNNFNGAALVPSNPLDVPNLRLWIVRAKLVFAH